MTNKRIIKILIFSIIVLLININRSYAAIEIKDSTSVFTNKTISEFYDMTEEMKNPGQGLEGSTVDVKMANNYEWAAVSYFSNSIYGTAGAGQNTGVQLADSTHKSTNGNITGVMDWGKTYSYTAGIISTYANITDTTLIANGQSIINAAGTSAIDKFSSTSAQAIARTGWYGSWDFMYGRIDQPYSFRSGIFGFAGAANISERCTGAANSGITFRPVFYAQ